MESMLPLDTVLEDLEDAAACEARLAEKSPRANLLPPWYSLEGVELVG